CQQYYSTPLTV
nr:immunoglobulin light chain junction region [Macaca mulatta]MPN94451.1 immunoglobulin light chain junction region [Macaca mulatta]MPN97773.1 immunoglobulin light chain junction region [Macaca mulatta]MPN98073.1 immunoglobulin light chain junction region [Macaca mulatta]MPN98761.1 immunoglobulin light chain junction region [Macaca mulatta]